MPSSGDLPEPGTEPVFAALAGRFPSTSAAWKALADLLFTIMEVTGVQYSDSRFLRIILQNTGCIPCAVQYLVVAYLFYM